MTDLNNDEISRNQSYYNTFKWLYIKLIKTDDQLHAAAFRDSL